MITIDIISPDSLDLDEYTSLQRKSYSELLTSRNVNNEFINNNYYTWKYHPPSGNAKIAIIKDKEAIVAANAMIPYNISGNKYNLKGWQSCDTATLPRYRGRGFFQKCIHALKESINENEIFFGFPNNNSISGFKKIGWIENSIITTWINPYLIFRKKHNDQIIEIKTFDIRFDDFFSQYKQKNLILLEKNSSYLNWRYCDNKNHTYTIFALIKNNSLKGFSVVRKANVLSNTICLIMELFSENNKYESDLLHQITWWAKKQNLKHAVLLDNQIPFMQQLSNGYFPVWHRILPKRQVFMGCVIGNNSIYKNLMSCNWKIQTGDWDAF
mgnify:CR=1 FL=1